MSDSASAGLRSLLQCHVRTRSLHQDYRWLGLPPDNHWWEQYGTWVNFEEPAFLLSTVRTTVLYFGRIPSGRKDWSGNRVTYTLALELESGALAADSVMRLTACWLDGLGPRDVAGPPWGPAPLGAILDEVFDEHRVAGVIDRLRASADLPPGEHRNQYIEQSTREVDPLLRWALQTVIDRTPVPPARLERGGQWVGSIRSRAVQENLQAHLQMIASGSRGPGLVLYRNAATDAPYLGRYLDRFPELALLVQRWDIPRPARLWPDPTRQLGNAARHVLRDLVGGHPERSGESPLPPTSERAPEQIPDSGTGPIVIPIDPSAARRRRVTTISEETPDVSEEPASDVPTAPPDGTEPEKFDTDQAKDLSDLRRQIDETRTHLRHLEELMEQEGEHPAVADPESPADAAHREDPGSSSADGVDERSMASDPRVRKWVVIAFAAGIGVGILAALAVARLGALLWHQGQPLNWSADF